MFENSFRTCGLVKKKNFKRSSVNLDLTEENICINEVEDKTR